MKITFLHTSDSHVKRFDEIVKKIDPSITIEHHVNQGLLAFAKRTGQTDQEGFRKEIAKIKHQNNKYVICTCSTYGDLCNAEEKVFRIDQPIGAYIVSNFSKIGIAYTVGTTKKISQKLIQDLATDIQKPIRIFEIDCQPAWGWFEKGNLDRYELEIANEIKKKADNSEVVFLAQASMDKAKKYLDQEKYQVVSSPEFGVKKYLELIRNHE